MRLTLPIRFSVNIDVYANDWLDCVRANFYIFYFAAVNILYTSRSNPNPIHLTHFAPFFSVMQRKQQHINVCIFTRSPHFTYIHGSSIMLHHIIFDSLSISSQKVKYIYIYTIVQLFKPIWKWQMILMQDRGQGCCQITPFSGIIRNKWNYRNSVWWVLSQI